MSLGTSRITSRGHQAVYTVPAGKKATVSATIYANSATPIVGIAANELGSYPSSIAVSDPSSTIALTNTGSANSAFGSAVSIDGNYAVVGSGLGTSSYVRVFFFDGTNWTLQQTINDPATGSNNFGSSVSISGDRLIVGAPYNDQDQPNQGRAYLYTRSGTTWSLTSTYQAPFGGAGQLFGWAVGISGTHVYITAPQYNNGTGNDGVVFYYSSYTSLTNYTFGPYGNDQLGQRLSMLPGGRAVVFNSGYNVTHQFTSGVINGTLSGSNYNASSFGTALASTRHATDTNLEFYAIRSNEVGPGGASAGVIRIFRNVGTTLLQTIVNPTTNTAWGGHYTINSVAMSMNDNGDLFVVAPSSTPVMYVYTRNNLTWTLTSTITLPIPTTPTPSGVCGHIISSSSQSGTTAAGNAWSVPNVLVADVNGSSGAGVAHFAGSRTAAAGLADAVGFHSAFGTDRVSLSANQTFERTGLVLDAGESLVVSNQNGGDIVAQVRGFVENA